MIATYKQEDGAAYLFYCDATWEVMNDSLYRNAEEAKRAAESQFEGVATTWVKA